MAFRRFYADAQFGKAERTGSGGLRVPATLTRTGVFVYDLGDGTSRRELRPPEEVFATDSLATLRGVAVTEGHPNKDVDPSNWKDVTIGHVGDSVSASGRFVSAPLVIQDGRAINKVDTKELVECSCGYFAELEMTSGVHQGEHYDAIQRNIRYNHVALGGRDWGRAGPDVRIRMDSADGVESREAREMAIKIDGKEYTEADVKALLDKEAKERKRADEAEGVIAKGRKDRLIAIVKDARTAKGLKVDEGDLSKMGEVDLMKALLETDPSFNPANTDEAYIRGCFEAYVLRMQKEGGAKPAEESTTVVPDANNAPPPAGSPPRFNGLDQALDSLTSARKADTAGIVDKDGHGKRADTTGSTKYTDSRQAMIQDNANRAKRRNSKEG